MTHTCNAYCRDDGLHCELFRVSPGTSEDQIWQALGYYRGLHVERVEPASEPPHEEPGEELICGTPGAAIEPVLVFFR